MKSGIYTITNTVNNKVYVGSSKDVYNRLSKHRSDLKNQVHHNEHLQKAINKYGLKIFKFELLEEYSNNDTILLNMENYWCNMLNTHNRNFGYNIQPINVFGSISISEETKIKISKSNLGRIHSEETRRKIGITKLGNKYFSGKTHTKETKEKLKKINTGKEVTIEIREKLRKINLGKILSEETKKKISNANKGHLVSAETRKKMSVYRLNNPLSPNKGKKLSKETIEKGVLKRIKPIYQYDLENNFIKKWESTIKAAKDLNLSKGNISSCLTGKRKQSGGFFWSKTLI